METELLAPAGNYQSLIAAVESGANAVYIGGRKYNARASADNFSDEDIIKYVKYAHIRNVKVYVTINILLSDEELVDALEYVQFLYNNDIDGIIVQDLGLLYLIKKYFPNMPVHCSTQMTIHNKDGVEVLSSLGADRFVLAREMNIKDISKLVKSTNKEIEIFVHGALCVCYSGQCLMSSFIGGRSGNRGRCAQPCRKKYTLVSINDKKSVSYNKKGYLLSPKDLKTIEHLNEIIELGIDSLKIEGRMKKPEYVAIVVNHYKNVLNKLYEGKSVTITEDIDMELESAFNRGFTNGFLFNEKKYNLVNKDKQNNRGVFLGKVLWQRGNKVAISIDNGSVCIGDGIEVIKKEGNSIGTIISDFERYSDDVIIIKTGHRLAAGSSVYKTYDKVLHDKVHKSYFFENKRKINLNAEIYIHLGNKIFINVWDEEGNNVRLESSFIVEEAEKATISEERVIAQLKKTGDTPYVFKAIEADIDNKVYVPMSAINDIRRKALKEINELRANRNKRKQKSLSKVDFIMDYKCNDEDDESIYFGATVWNYNNAKAAIDSQIDYIYYGSFDKIDEVVKLCHDNNIDIYFYLPNIIKDDEKKRYINIIKENDLDGIVISNISQIKLADVKPGLKMIGNYNLNVFNKKSMDILLGLGIETICPSIELNLKQIESIANYFGTSMELVVYGQLPLMTMEYCPLSSPKGCYKCKNRDTFGLKDEKGSLFPIFCIGNRPQLLNSHVLFIAESMKKIKSLGVKRIRLDFYREKSEDVRKIIELYRNYHELDKGRFDNIIKKVKEYGHTRGHYFRGVD